jgi:hypothetical protein
MTIVKWTRLTEICPLPLAQCFVHCWCDGNWQSPEPSGARLHPGRRTNLQVSPSLLCDVDHTVARRWCNYRENAQFHIVRKRHSLRQVLHTKPVCEISLQFRITYVRAYGCLQDPLRKGDNPEHLYLV